MRRRSFLASFGTVAITGCTGSGGSGERVVTRTVVVQHSPGPTPTPKVVTKTIPVPPEDTPTPRVRTVVVERTVIRTTDPTPLPDAPVVKNVYLNHYEETWIYIDVRYTVPNHDDQFYTMEHLILEDDSGNQIYEQHRETEVNTSSNEERVAVTPYWFSISRVRNDLPAGTYTVKLEVTDQVTDKQSDLYSTEIEIG